MGQGYDNPKLGAFAMSLTPDPSNEMFNRSGFFIHGDTSAMNHSASEGCIIIGRSFRNQLAASDDNQLQVIAE